MTYCLSMVNHKPPPQKKKSNMSSVSGLNFKSLFLSVDNEMKTSALQRLAISLGGSSGREMTILHIASQALPSVRSLPPQGAPASPEHAHALPWLASLSPHRETRTRESTKPNTLPAVWHPEPSLLTPDLGREERPLPLALRGLISNARAAGSKPGLDLRATSPDKSQNPHGTCRVTLNNLPSGSNVVSLTKLEGRARDNVAMVTTTRQTKRPQLTMVTVPMPGPLPYLHVDVNPICTLPLRAWTASHAFSLRWAPGPRCCRCR